jgi:hypothetical protein
MKHFLIIIILLLNCNTTFAQVLPANRYFNNYILDSESTSPSFAYSLRKLRAGYSGFAVKIRRGTDNAEANVQFDNFDRVSTTSIVTVTNVGTSTLTMGQNLSYNTFAGAQTISVTTWYDQGTNAYHATQTTNSKQPTLILNSAGPTNTLPSVNFNPVNAHELIINQPVENLLTNGINGSALTICKGSNNSQISFGARMADNWRWSTHINWSDGNCYFDAAEVCCATNRAFNNTANNGIYKQYSFIRGVTYKTMRLNSTATVINNSAAASTAKTGGNFSIGYWSPSVLGGHSTFNGNFCEILLFPTDLNITKLNSLENSQILYWL